MIDYTPVIRRVAKLFAALYYWNKGTVSSDAAANFVNSLWDKLS